MLTVLAGGGLLAVLGALDVALVLVCRGFGDEPCDDGAAAVELRVPLVGADGVREAVRVPVGDARGLRFPVDVGGAAPVPEACPPGRRDDD